MQKLFKELRNGNQNAFGELHRQLRLHMNKDADKGVFTQIYNKFHIEEVDREDVNQDIVLLVWQKIMTTTKLDKMRDWKEMKSYSSSICYKKCQALVKKKKIIHLDDFVVIGGVKINLNEDINIKTGLTKETEKMIEEIFELFDRKCRYIWKAIVKFPEKKDSQKVIDYLKDDITFAREYSVPTGDTYTKVKSKCKSNLIKKARKHNNYDEWKQQFKDFFEEDGDNYN